MSYLPMLSLSSCGSTAKQRHRPVPSSLQYINANGRYSYKTETLIDVTGIEHNRQWTSHVQNIATNGRYHYKISQLIDTTTDVFNST